MIRKSIKHATICILLSLFIAITSGLGLDNDYLSPLKLNLQGNISIP